MSYQYLRWIKIRRHKSPNFMENFTFRELFDIETLRCRHITFADLSRWYSFRFRIAFRFSLGWHVLTQVFVLPLFQKFTVLLNDHFKSGMRENASLKNPANQMQLFNVKSIVSKSISIFAPLDIYTKHPWTSCMITSAYLLVWTIVAAMNLANANYEM